MDNHLLASILSSHLISQQTIAIVAAYIASIQHDLIRDQRYLTTQSLTGISNSAWRTLYNQRNDTAWRDTICFKPDSFDRLLGVFTPIYWPHYNDEHKRMGRPPIMEPYDVLGVLLMWLIGPVRTKHLCLIFGLPPTTINRTINKGIQSLAVALEQMEMARVIWPSTEQMKELAQRGVGRKNAIPGCIGFIDGTLLKIPSSANEQYICRKKFAAINNVFAFATDGTIIWAQYNCPGSWHDSKVCSPLYKQIRDTMPLSKSYCFVADSAFRTKDMYNLILKPITQSETNVTSERVEQSRQIVAVRQAAEWGISAFKRMFPRLNWMMNRQPSVRRLILYVCIRLFNLRARIDGNQIYNVFDPDWIASFNIRQSSSAFHRVFRNLYE